MRDFKKCRIFLACSVAALLVACLAVCFSEMVARISREEGNDIPLYLTGGVFWAGLICTYVFTGAAAICRKRGLKSDKDGFDSGRPGMLCFFRNREAKIIDVIMAVSIIALLIGIFGKADNSVFILGAIFMTIFSVHMHGILNGKNYQYIRERQGAVL